MFDQIPGHTVARSSWCMKLTITVSGWVNEKQRFLSCGTASGMALIGLYHCRLQLKWCLANKKTPSFLSRQPQQTTQIETMMPFHVDLPWSLVPKWSSELKKGVETYTVVSRVEGWQGISIRGKIFFFWWWNPKHMQLPSFSKNLK